MHTFGKLSTGRSLRNRLQARLDHLKDGLTFGAFEAIAGRQPNDDEYFGSRTRGELMRKAFKARTR